MADVEKEEVYESHNVLDTEHSLPAVRDWTKAWVKQEIEKLDSSATAAEDHALTSVTITDGKISAFKDVSLNTKVQAADDYALTGITVKNGQIVGYNEVLLNSSVEASAGNVLSGITIKNGKIVDHKEFNITKLYRFRGSVATQADLPTRGMIDGDVYSIVARSDYGMPNQNVAWASDHWDPLGPTLTIDPLVLKIGKADIEGTNYFTYQGENKTVVLGNVSLINTDDNADSFLRGDGTWGTFSTMVTGTKVTSATGADKLNTTRHINNTAFDGTGDITTNVWGYSRNFTIKDSTFANAGAVMPIDGGTDVTLTLPSTIEANITGTSLRATNDADGNLISDTYLKRSGGTMTGWLNFASGAKNYVGEDSTIGDFGADGLLGIQGQNGTTGIALLQNGATWTTDANYGTISYDGSSVISSKPTSAPGGTFTDTLNIKSATGDYREGIRIYSAPSGWTTLALLGDDTTSDHGTSPKSWTIHNHSGEFYINKNGSNTINSNTLSNTDGTWRIGNNPIITTAGATFNGNINLSNSGTTLRQIHFTVGDNDYARIAAGATASNAGFMEIATADDGNEPIYVRQYAPGDFGTIKRTATLLDANGNTSFPGNVAASTFSGGTFTMNDAAQIRRNGNSVSWISGRDGAIVRQTSYNGYNPIISTKTTNGSWEIGPYTEDNLHISYISDANYNAGNNAQTVDFCIHPNGSLSGVTLPWGSVTGKPTFYQNDRGYVNRNTDYNSLTAAGSYKVQDSAWGDAATKHGPNGLAGGLYTYGILMVYKTPEDDTEHRLVQVYMPHNTGANSWCFRWHNGTDYSVGWSGWQWLSTDTDKSANYLPLSGGTMSGNIAFAATATTGTSSRITFSGSTDGAQIYYNAAASDQGNLVLNMTDDANAYIQFAYNGAVHSYISPSNGVYHGPSTAVIDSGDGRTLYFNYSASGMSSTSWLGSWNGNTLQAISPANITAGAASKVVGSYSGNGGQQGPGYYGRGRAGFLMSNASVNGDGHYKNWLYMDNYSGNDVGGATAIGVDRQEPRAFIMQSDANRSAWNNSAELVTSYNFNWFGSTSATANTVVRRDGNGYVYAQYYNQASGAETPNGSSYWIYANSDGWFRKSSLGNLKSVLGVGAPIYDKYIDGNYASQTRSQAWGSGGNGTFLSIVRNNTANVSGSPQYGSGLISGKDDTHMYLYVNYASANFYVGGGNAGKLNWVRRVITEADACSDADINSCISMFS